MPGYDKNRFINLKDEDELMCGICHGIFIDPNVTPCCRQTYCADCIKQWLEVNSSCPNDRQPLHANNLFPAPRIIFNMLNKLLMKCEYRKNGCKENFILENIEGHIKICVYNPNNICIDCDHLIGNRSSHNCIKNLNSENKKLKEDNKKIEHKCHLSEMTLNSVNERCEEYLKELNDLKVENSKYEKQIKIITEKNKTLSLNQIELVDKNKKLKQLSSKLYKNLKSIESDMVPLPTNNDSDLKNVIKTLEKYVDRQLNSDTQRNNVVYKLSKFSSNIENDILFKEIYNETNVIDDSDVTLINWDTLYYEEDQACSETTFTFKIEGFSKMSGPIMSPPILVRNIPWKLVVNPKDGPPIKYLEIYLTSDEISDHTLWSCNVSAELTLIKHMVGKNWSKKCMVEFNNKCKKMLFSNLFDYNVTLNSKNGWINEDTIIFEIYVSAKVPNFT